MKRVAIVFFSLLLLYSFISQAQALTCIPGLPWGMPTHHTTVQSSSSWIFSSVVLSNDSLVFTQTYIGSGSSIGSLSIASVGANLTLDQLSLSGQTSFAAAGNGSSTIVLSGYGQEPGSVMQDNATLVYSYTSRTDILTMHPLLNGMKNGIHLTKLQYKIRYEFAVLLRKLRIV